MWIFSDSQAAIQRLQHTRSGPGHELTALIHDQITKLHTSNRICTTICWVPGHTDVAGNEEADVLAKQGTTLQPTEQTTTTLAWLKRQVRAQRIEEWTHHWHTTHNGSSYEGEPRLKLDDPLKLLPRFETSTIVQLRTGHGYFNSYLATKSTARTKIPFTTCQCKAPDQTPKHLLLYCIRYKEERQKLRKYTAPFLFTTYSILHSSKGVKALAAFLRHTMVAKRPNILSWSEERRRGEEEMGGD